MRFHDCPEHGLGQQRRHSVSDLLLTKTDRSLEFEAVWEGLQTRSFAYRQTTVLMRMDQHVLAEIANDYGRLRRV